ncbi:hypothetical protein ACFX2A_026290 [Malus domestica]
MKDSGLKPNLVTYNAVIDAYGKGEWGSRGRGGLWEAAQNLCSEMVDRGIDQNIYTYNTLLDAICKGGQMDLAYQMMSEKPSKNILANVLGRFEDALNVCKEMESVGIAKVVVSYNALLGGLRMVNEMKEERVSPNILTYSTLIDVFSKGGLYAEAMKVFKEFKHAGLKAEG